MYRGDMETRKHYTASSLKNISTSCILIETHTMISNRKTADTTLQFGMIQTQSLSCILYETHVNDKQS